MKQKAHQLAEVEKQPASGADWHHQELETEASGPPLPARRAVSYTHLTLPTILLV